MTRPRQLRTLRAFHLRFSAAGLAFACVSSSQSGDDGSSTNTWTPSPEDGTTAPGLWQETCADNGLLAGCLPSTPPPHGGWADPAALAEAAAKNVLNSNCGPCHGPTRPGASATGPVLARERAGLDYIDDIDRLVTLGKIMPLNSAGSPIIQRMQNGDMPPLASGLPPVTEADVDTVAQFIDNPRFWPTYVASDCNSQNPQMGFDELLQTINQDLMVADTGDAPFYRYLSLSNRVTAGVCADAALDQGRHALVQMMNLLSNGDQLGKVVPIDPNRTIYRVDLRDFNWNHPVVVNGQSFADVWEATAANNPFNVQWVGDDANLAIAGCVRGLFVKHALRHATAAGRDGPEASDILTRRVALESFRGESRARGDTTGSSWCRAMGEGDEPFSSAEGWPSKGPAVCLHSGRLVRYAVVRG